MANPFEPDPTLAASIYAFCGLVLGVLGTAIGNIFRSRASMAAIVDARIRLLIDGYEKRIGDLQTEVMRLEGKIDALTALLEIAHRTMRESISSH